MALAGLAIDPGSILLSWDQTAVPAIKPIYNVCSMRAEVKPQQTSECHGDRRGGECNAKTAGRNTASHAPSLEARKSSDRAHAKCLREEDRARLEASDLNSQVLGSLRR